MPTFYDDVMKLADRHDGEVERRVAETFKHLMLVPAIDLESKGIHNGFPVAYAVADQNGATLDTQYFFEMLVKRAAEGEYDTNYVEAVATTLRAVSDALLATVSGEKGQ